MITRRTLLLGAAAPRGAIEREVFMRSPGKGSAVMAFAYYAKPAGGEMFSIEERWSRSDTMDVAYFRRSQDFGKSWSAPVERKTGEKTSAGMLRRHLRGGWVDPVSGRLLEFWLEGVLPTDDPLEGLRQWRIYYTVDGGPIHQVIHKGPEYDAKHWLPGVVTGQNCAMLGDHTCQPISMKDGSILWPVAISPKTAEGKLYNPGGGYTYHDTGVLISRWKGDALEFEMGPPIKADPARTTRGLDEATIGHLTKDRLIMVIRGSNDRNPSLPSWRWVTTSKDGGRTWAEAAPWTYHDKAPFYSPSACSQLINHSDGKLYWIGNITPENPRGNRPRYPIVIGEVDQDSGLLIRESVRTIDDKGPDDDPLVTLSNFYAREDRQTKGIALHMTRLVALKDGWVGDALLYKL